MAAVPLRDVVVDAGEQAALEDAEEDPRGHQPPVALHEALADHRGAPADHDEREPQGGPEPLHHHVARDLRRDVEREEDREAVVVLEAVEAQVVL